LRHKAERIRADNPANDPDAIGIEDSIKYLNDLEVKLNEVIVLAVLTELSAPFMSAFTGEGFVEG